MSNTFIAQEGLGCLSSPNLIFLLPDVVILFNFKLSQFDLPDLVIWKHKGIRHLDVKIYGLESRIEKKRENLVGRKSHGRFRRKIISSNEYP